MQKEKNGLSKVEKDCRELKERNEIFKKIKEKNI